MIGYAFGAGATAAFRRVAHYETWLLVASLAVGIGVHLLTHRLGKRVT